MESGTFVAAQSVGTSENKPVIKPQREIRPEAVPDDVRGIINKANMTKSVTKLYLQFLFGNY